MSFEGDLDPVAKLNMWMLVQANLVKLYCPDCGEELAKTYSYEDKYWRCGANCGYEAFLSDMDQLHLVT